jgi:hypothetical protein
MDTIYDRRKVHQPIVHVLEPSLGKTRKRRGEEECISSLYGPMIRSSYRKRLSAFIARSCAVERLAFQKDAKETVKIGRCNLAIN